MKLLWKISETLKKIDEEYCETKTYCWQSYKIIEKYYSKSMFILIFEKNLLNLYTNKLSKSY